MKKILLISAIVLFTTISSLGKKYIYKTFDWGDIPTIQKNITDEKRILLSEQIIELEAYHRNFEYSIIHSIEYINSEEQIGINNRKYFPHEANEQIIRAKMRVVSPSGRVIEMDESEIYISKNEIDNKEYMYFALKGLEIGSILEYYIITKRKIEIYGRRIFIQNKFFIEEFRFRLYCEGMDDFKFKFYNTESLSVSKKYIDKNYFYEINMKSIPGMPKEEQAPYYRIIKQFAFATDLPRINYSYPLSFERIGESYYNGCFYKLSKKDKRLLKKINKSINCSDIKETKDKIIAIERYIKENITYKSVPDRKYKEIHYIGKSKTANRYGLIAIMGHLFTMNNIGFDLVLVTDNFRNIFDSNFPSYHYITDIVFYFPSEKKYLNPIDYNYRYGFINPNYTNGNGLAIKKSFSPYSNSNSNICFIEPNEYSESISNIDCDVEIFPDSNFITMNLYNSESGLLAIGYNNALSKMNNTNKKEFIEKYFKNRYSNGEIINYQLDEISDKDLFFKPFGVKYYAKCFDFTINADNRLIFKIGKLIGIQKELYSEKERNLPVDIKFKRQFVRKLVIRIPEGYTVKNIDDLNMHVAYKTNGQETLLFESKYETNSDEIIVYLNEYYDQINFKVSEYESYRKVVNAAADFEKITLIFEKNENLESKN